MQCHPRWLNLLVGQIEAALDCIDHGSPTGMYAEMLNCQAEIRNILLCSCTFLDEHLLHNEGEKKMRAAQRLGAKPAQLW